MKKYTLAVKGFENGTLSKKIWTNLWKVENTFVWYIIYNDKQKEGRIIVPKWFITDFGSIPKSLWSIFNPTKYLAYILHDYLYSINNRLSINTTRKQADKILRDALKIEWMWLIKRNLVYLACRCFWFLFYKKK